MNKTFEYLQNLLLKLLKLPHEPSEPNGPLDTVRTFNPSPAYYKYKLLRWLIKTLLTLAGTVILSVLAFLYISSLAKKFPYLPFSLFMALGISMIVIIFTAFIILSIFSYITVRLDFQLRWYKVSDRCLKIREGVFTVKEINMALKNIQNIYILQGPLQRFFGISDVEVESAGGGSSSASPNSDHRIDIPSTHMAYFRGMDKPDVLRDLIITRLKRIQSSGLGNPDEDIEQEDYSYPSADYTDAVKEERSGNTENSESGDPLQDDQEYRLFISIRDELKAFNASLLTLFSNK